MSAARTLAALAAAGGALEAPPGAGLRVRAPAPLPPGLRAEVRAAAPALLRVASGRWRLDLAAWPLWRLDLFEERAALMAEGGVAPELVEQLAYLDTAEQPEPAPDPEPPEGALEVSSDDTPPRAPRPGRPLARTHAAGAAGAAGGRRPPGRAAARGAQLEAGAPSLPAADLAGAQLEAHDRHPGPRHPATIRPAGLPAPKYLRENLKVSQDHFEKPAENRPMARPERSSDD